MANNVVIRERYNGLVEVNGQLIPQRGEVKPEELVETRPDDEGAHNNGAGAAPKRREVKPEELVETRPDDEGAHNNGAGAAPKRRRRNTIDEE